MNREQLGNLMVFIICISAIVLIFDIDVFPGGSKPLPVDVDPFHKYPVARIELTMEKLAQLMGWNDSRSANPVSV
jgi:hypothetical protein